MRALSVDVRDSTGKTLCCAIFRADGKKLLARGHYISHDDVSLLQTEGMKQVWVTGLEEGEVPEDDAVLSVSTEAGCGALEVRLAAGGRANLVTTEPTCILVDDELLRRINCTSSVVIATSANFSYAKAGQRVATVKSSPFAVAKTELDATMSMLKERGPLLQARPIRSPAVAVLFTDAVNGDRARHLFEATVRQRLERLGVSETHILAVLEEEEVVSRALRHLLRVRPATILIASTTVPAGPEDIVGRSMLRAGCEVERFLAPVEPGSLLLLGYNDNIPVVSAPGCFSSAKPNVVDLILPPMLARYRISAWEIAALGHGGLLGQRASKHSGEPPGCN